jgi:hypothetical protein
MGVCFAKTAGRYYLGSLWYVCFCRSHSRAAIRAAANETFAPILAVLDAVRLPVQKGMSFRASSIQKGLTMPVQRMALASAAIFEYFHLKFVVGSNGSWEMLLAQIDMWMVRLNYFE